MEYEQILLKDNPKSINDIAVSIKMHFGLNIVKTIWVGSSILVKESEMGLMNTVNSFVKDKLRLHLQKA
jgi:hypothetical protein